jgi:hypothetical protein
MSRINGSALMFDEEDVKTTSEFLPRLIRIIMFATGVTNDGYITRYHRYFKSIFPSKSRKEFTQKSAADRKSLLDKSKLTFSLMRTVLSAMGYDIECVSIRVKDRVTGDVRTFSTDNTVEELKDFMAQEKEIGVQSL